MADSEKPAPPDAGPGMRADLKEKANGPTGASRSTSDSPTSTTR